MTLDAAPGGLARMASTVLALRMIKKPALRPADPRFSPGPTAKRPGWSPAVLEGAALGRNHRSSAGKAKLGEAIARTAALLAMPADYRLAIVPGSDTGAVEIAMWTLLGPRGVDVFAWEAFGREWVTDAVEALRLPDLRIIEAAYGRLPDLARADPARDMIFCWNGTTSGVRVPDADFIADHRDGLVICDATSAAFAQALDWRKLDVVTFSWQKALGGEAAHGMMALSPRALARLTGDHRPAWPVPKLFRLAKDGRVDPALFEGSTINTPSLLVVEDWLDALGWAEGIGGLDALIARADANAAVVYDWLGQSPWAAPLCADPAHRSNTSVCLRFTDPGLTPAAARALQSAIVNRLEAEGAGYDLGAYREAPPGLRIWTGATVERASVAALLPWLDWAYAEARASVAA